MRALTLRDFEIDEVIDPNGMPHVFVGFAFRLTLKEACQVRADPIVIAHIYATIAVSRHGACDCAVLDCVIDHTIVGRVVSGVHCAIPANQSTYPACATTR